MRGLWGGVALAVLAAGCSTDTFVCMADVQCGAEGRCEPAGVCSVPDPDCPSGHRYVESAGHFSGQCVEPSGDTEPGTGSTGAPGTGGPGTTPTEPGSTDSTSGPAQDDTTGPASCAQWWDCAWGARMALDIAPTREDLSLVPVAVWLDPRRFDYGLADPGGADLRFVADDDQTLLPYEIDHWDPGGTSLVWIRVDALRSGPAPVRVWLYLSNPAAPSAEDPPQVWSNGYRAVWHLGDRMFADSSGHVGSCIDEGVDQAEGYFGPAVVPALGGGLDCGQDGLNELFVDGGTISAWIHPAGPSVPGPGRIVDKATDTTPGGYNLAINDDEQMHFARGYATGLGLWRTPIGSVPFGSWSHVAVTYTEGDAAASPSMFVDGILQELASNAPPSGDPDDELGAPLAIGNIAATADRTFEGIIDEVRLSDGLRSEAWLQFQDAAGRDQVITYGAIESAPRP